MDTNSGHEKPETNLERLFDPEDYSLSTSTVWEGSRRNRR